MIRIGLTGGIGSGKTEVTKRLAELGAFVIDYDALARQAVAPGSAGLAAVAAEFGPVLAADGSLDRAKLAAIVFADPDALRRLEEIVHPAVFRLALAAEAALPPDAVVVHAVPLLAELGLAQHFDKVVVVDAPYCDRFERVRARDGLTREQARLRFDVQAKRQDRLDIADHVIVNDSTLEALRAQADALYERLSG
jgi:dephospho-CoA kinase